MQFFSGKSIYPGGSVAHLLPNPICQNQFVRKIDAAGQKRAAIAKRVLMDWKKVLDANMHRHCTEREVTQQQSDNCGNPTNALSCSRAWIEMCKDFAQSMDSRRECNSKIALELISNSGLFYHVLQLYHAYHVLQLVNEGFFTAAGLLGLPPRPPSVVI